MYQNRGAIETGERKTNLKGIMFMCCYKITTEWVVKARQLWRPEVQDQVSVSSSLFFGISSSSYKVNSQIGLGFIITASSS